MHSITGTFQAGRIELPDSVNWPDGTKVEIRPLVPGLQAGVPAQLNQWPAGFFDHLRADWGQEPFERPAQGELELREDW